MGAGAIFIAVPVYRGVGLVEETLRSILAQDFEDYRVLISVDGGDDESASACAAFTSDPRFRVTVQPEQLGWAGNLNWLMTQSDAEYFCYWQQDDVCDASYLRTLQTHASSHPEAACTYCDVQWFGGRADREELPSLTGPPVERVLQQFELGHFAPFRGLIRRKALLAAGPLRLTAYDSRMEDLVWVAKLARGGELHRIPQALYFKRAHETNAHSHSRPLAPEFCRGAWMEYGLGLLEAALPLAGSSIEQMWWMHTVLERLIVTRPGRWYFYDSWQDGPDSLIRFANEFVDQATARFRLPDTPRLPDSRAALSVLAASGRPDQRLAGLCLGRIGSLSAEVATRGRLVLRMGIGETGESVLLDGWSSPEVWGVWSDGPAARLRIPLPSDGGQWSVELIGHGYAPGTLLARCGDAALGEWSWGAGEPIRAGLTLLGEEKSIVELEFPTAVSPAQMGESSDKRLLGLGLTAIAISRV